MNILEMQQLSEVDLPKSNIRIFWTTTFEWYVVKCGPKNWHFLKRHVFKKDGTMFSKYVNHSRLNSQHDQGNLYDHLMSTRIFTLIMHMIFI